MHVPLYYSEKQYYSAMSLKKCRKFLRNTEGFDNDLPPIKRQPIVLGDSKVGYLRAQASSYIENEIEWWYGPGWDSTTGRKCLLSKIEDAILTYGRVHLYVWLGTCNLTVKPKKYVYLNPRHGCAQFIRGGFRKFCHRCYNFVNRHNRLLYYTLIERATFLLYNDAKTMHEKK